MTVIGTTRPSGHFGATENTVPTQYDEVKIGNHQVSVTSPVDCLQVNIDAGTNTKLLISGSDASLTVDGKVIILNADAESNKILQVINGGKLECK